MNQDTDVDMTFLKREGNQRKVTLFGGTQWKKEMKNVSKKKTTNKNLKIPYHVGTGNIFFLEVLVNWKTQRWVRYGRTS